MTTTTTTKTNDFADRVLNYVDTIESDHVMRAVRYDGTVESIQAIQSLDGIEKVDLKYPGTFEPMLISTCFDPEELSNGDYVVEDSWNGVYVITTEQMLQEELAGTMLFRKLWTLKNIHEWEMDASDMGTDQTELAEWVDEHIRVTATVETIQGMVDNPDQYIAQACKALGWHSVPQSGGLCITVWRYRMGINE